LDGVRLLVGCSDSFSFPSGHATNAFALAAFFATYYRRRAVLLFVMAALVGYSRIYVGVHYPLDVLGGAFLGVTFGLAVGVSSRKLVRRWLKKRVEIHGREASPGSRVDPPRTPDPRRVTAQSWWRWS
jgi:membrane-associated phospholipid phosphatase